LEDVLRQLSSFRSLSAIEIAVNIADILLVSYMIYRVLMLVRGTRAWRILLGVLAFLTVLFVSDKLHLNTLHWILDKATLLGPVALVILFLPELRHTIEGFGKITAIPIIPSRAEDRVQLHTIEELTAAVSELAQEHVGALIIIEMKAPLDEIALNGVRLDAEISAPLLNSIFYEGNPLHDGAVLMRGDRLLAAACRLPLSESQWIDANLHMRHRAAVGVSEMLDSLSIVVSEERGHISVAKDGILKRMDTPHELREFLNRELRHIEPEPAEKKDKSRRKPKVAVEK
jgi:diadenylate cyclase